MDLGGLKKNPSSKALFMKRSFFGPGEPLFFKKIFDFFNLSFLGLGFPGGGG
jgi:hypothetical protein